MFVAFSLHLSRASSISYVQLSFPTHDRPSPLWLSSLWKRTKANNWLYKRDFLTSFIPGVEATGGMTFGVKLLSFNRRPAGLSIKQNLAA